MRGPARLDVASNHLDVVAHVVAPPPQSSLRSRGPHHTSFFDNLSLSRRSLGRLIWLTQLLAVLNENPGKSHSQRRLGPSSTAWTPSAHAFALLIDPGTISDTLHSPSIRILRFASLLLLHTCPSFSSFSVSHHAGAPIRVLGGADSESEGGAIWYPFSRRDCEEYTFSSGDASSHFPPVSRKPIRSQRLSTPRSWMKRRTSQRLVD